MGKGNLNRLFTQNFSMFEDDQVIDLSNSVNVIVGDNHTGKTTLLKMISAINVFRTSCRRDVRRTENGFHHDDKELSNVFKTITEYEEDGVLRFRKTKAEMESLFVVEAEGEHPAERVYYGLYCTEADEEWCYNSSKNRHSPAFVLHGKELYLLCATSTDNIATFKFTLTKALSLENNISNTIKQNINSCVSVLRKTAQEVNVRDDTIEKVTKLPELPDNLQHLLPSVLCTDTVCAKAGLRKDRNDKQTNILDYVANLLSTSPVRPKLSCFLVECPYSDAFKREIDQSLGTLSKHKFQVVMTTYRAEILTNGYVQSVIRLWRTSEGLTRASKVPRMFIKECKDMDFDLPSVLSHNLLMFVEGPSDTNILEAVLDGHATKVSSSKGQEIDLSEVKKIRIHVQSVKGKAKFYKALKVVLCQRFLGLIPLIVCDGDAVTGEDENKKTKIKSDPEPLGARSFQKVGTGSTPGTPGGMDDNSGQTSQLDVNQNIESKISRSKIYCAKKESVVFTCISQVKDKKDWVCKAYVDLSSLRCLSDITCRAENKDIIQAIEKIVKQYCKNADGARSFARGYLFTFAWDAPPDHDLESVISLTSRHFKYNKSKLGEDQHLAQDIANHMMKRKNPELLNLLTYLAKALVSAHKRAELHRTPARATPNVAPLSPSTADDSMPDLIQDELTSLFS